MGSYGIQRERSLVEDAITFATEESRYSDEPGLYVPQSELDGKVHRLDVTVPGRPRYVAALPEWIRRGGQNGRWRDYARRNLHSNGRVGEAAVESRGNGARAGTGDADRHRSIRPCRETEQGRGPASHQDSRSGIVPVHSLSRSESVTAALPFDRRIGNAALLVECELRDVVDEEHIDRSSRILKVQPKLLVQSFENRWSFYFCRRLTCNMIRICGLVSDNI